MQASPKTKATVWAVLPGGVVLVAGWSEGLPDFFFYACIIVIYLFSFLNLKNFNPHSRIMLTDFGERGGREREKKERERNINVRNISQVPPQCILTRDQTWSLGMCPDRELNPQPFDVKDNAPTNWATWLGLYNCFLMYLRPPHIVLHLIFSFNIYIVSISTCH